MASELYGEEWNSEEFQTALKVVLKVEIQSLLERLSETGEETVVVTASAADGVTGHLASSNAIRFINTADMGTVKSKFLTFLTGGGQTQVGKQTVQASPVVRGQMSPSTGVICNNMMSKVPAPLLKSEPTMKKPDVNVVPPAQPKGPEKRPLDQGPGSIGVVQPIDPKRRKTDTQCSLVKGVSSVSQQSSPATSTNVAQTLANSNKPQAPKLKTTKVVSKSGGFTEERISDAEFQKFLAQYKPEIPEEEEDDDDEDSDIDNRSSKLRTGSIIPSQQKQLQSHPGSSVQNTQNKGPSLGNTSNLLDKNVKGRIIPPSVNQSVKNVNQSSEVKKDNSSVKVDNLCVAEMTEIKEEDDPEDLAYKEAQVTQKSEQSLVKGSQDSQQKKETTGKADKTATANKSRIRIDNIDNMDTATLIEMTKAKHLENMSPADREIQAKLGQISSKLSWVVEYPQDKKGQPVPISHSTPMPRGPEGTGVMGSKAMGLHGPFPHSEGEDYEEMEEDELDDEDDEDFNEDDLDEEDKAKLKALREEHMRKAYIEGYGVSQDFHAGMGHMMGPGFPEDYGEEDEEEGDEDYEDYGEEMEIHMQGNRMPNLMGPNLGPGPGEGIVSSGSQLYQRSASPTSENFLMIGPIMAKCLICNKIVRKTEMKAHNETHLEDEVYDEDEEEEEEEIPEEDLEEEENEEEGHYAGEQQEEDGEFGEEQGGDYSEEYTIHEDTSQEPVFTAEKFVAETLVAEKLEDSSVEMTTMDDNQNNVCDICNKTFKSKANVQRHKKTQHAADGKPTEIICPCCNKKYKPSSIKNHLKKLHPEYKEPLPANIGSGSDISADCYKCGMCGEDFTTEELLQDHVKESHV